MAGKSLGRTVRIVRDEPPRRLRLPDPAIGPGAATIAAKCLQKQAVDRYPSAAELAVDLQRLLDGHKPRARPPGPLARLQDRARRHRGATLAGLVALVATLIGAMLVIRSGLEEAAVRRPSSATGPGPTAEFPNVSSLRTTPLQWIAVTFGEPVQSLSPADFRLTRNGVDVPLTGVEVVGQRTAWEVRGLEQATSEEGRYVLELRGTRDTPVDFAGRRLGRPGPGGLADAALLRDRLQPL